jgi:hypothetical protein
MLSANKIIWLQNPLNVYLESKNFGANIHNLSVRLKSFFFNTLMLQGSLSGLESLTLSFASYFVAVAEYIHKPLRGWFLP